MQQPRKNNNKWVKSRTYLLNSQSESSQGALPVSGLFGPHCSQGKSPRLTFEQGLNINNLYHFTGLPDTYFSFSHTKCSVHPDLTAAEHEPVYSNTEYVGILKGTECLTAIHSWLSTETIKELLGLSCGTQEPFVFVRRLLNTLIMRFLDTFTCFSLEPEIHPN